MTTRQLLLQCTVLFLKLDVPPLQLGQVFLGDVDLCLLSLESALDFALDAGGAGAVAGAFDLVLSAARTAGPV
jgi:hypothetical protein